MSDQESIFETKQESPEPQVNPLEDLLGSIKRDDGSQVYSSVEDALKAIPHARQHINTIQSENKELNEQVAAMKEELAKLKGANEVVDRLAQKQEQESQPAPSLDEEYLAQFVKQTLSATEQEKIMQENGSKVSQALTEKYGEKAKEEFERVAQETGLSSADLSNLARKSPQAVLKLFGEGGSKVTPSTSSINTEALPQSSAPNTPPPFSNVGSSAKEASEHMKWHIEEIYKKHGIKQ